MSMVLLLAQAGGPVPDDIPRGVFIILAIIIGGAVAMTAIIAGINHANKERELNHAERMKALEQGINVDELEEERRFRKGLMRLAFGIGVVVPICAAGSATGALTGMGTAASGFTSFIICSVAASIGVAGVASGAWLAQNIMARFGSAARRNTTTTQRPYDAPEAATALR